METITNTCIMLDCLDHDPSMDLVNAGSFVHRITFCSYGLFVHNEIECFCNQLLELLTLFPT